MNPDFGEWMMGWPHQWTKIGGVSKTQRIKMCGNGVVPHQALEANYQLLGRIMENA